MLTQTTINSTQLPKYMEGGRTPEEIKRATGHRTASAFDRYLEIQGDELRAIYAQTRTPTIRIEDVKGNKI